MSCLFPFDFERSAVIFSLSSPDAEGKPAMLSNISAVTGRTLYRYVLRAAHNANKVRTCERWMETQAEAETDALVVAAEYGGKRPMKVALVFPVPVMSHALNDAAGAP